MVAMSKGGPNLCLTLGKILTLPLQNRHHHRVSPAALARAHLQCFSVSLQTKPVKKKFLEFANFKLLLGLQTTFFWGKTVESVFSICSPRGAKTIRQSRI
jgi:hypothetical protein